MGDFLRFRKQSSPFFGAILNVFRIGSEVCFINYFLKINRMKKTLVTGTAIVLLAACSSAQKTDRSSGEKGEKAIPAAVKQAFTQQFPNADDVDWEQEG